MLNTMKTGLWRIGKGYYGQIRLNLITLGQMERYMSRNNKENYYQIALQHLLSNMEKETILWYGVVWGGMEWESS